MSQPLYETEAASAAALDDLLHRTGLFRVHSEVRGTLLQPRPSQVDRGVRIDRILIPEQRLLDLGWKHGLVGIEIKRSGVKIGPPIAQAMDYTRAVWSLPYGFRVILDWVFVWPEDKQHGPLASLMAQNRVGTVTSTAWTLLQFNSGEQTLLHVSRDGTIRVGAGASGTRVGSR